MKENLRLSAPFALSLLLLAVILAVAAGKGWDDDSSFWRNLGLNGVAELTGLAAGVLVAVPLALRFARSRVKAVGSQVAAAIAQLRVDGTITDQGARRAMICAVALLDEEHLGAARSLCRSNGPLMSCGVCSLEVETNNDRCSHCGLHGDHWNVPDLKPGSRHRNEVQPQED